MNWQSQSALIVLGSLLLSMLGTSLGLTWGTAIRKMLDLARERGGHRRRRGQRFIVLREYRMRDGRERPGQRILVGPLVAGRPAAAQFEEVVEGVRGELGDGVSLSVKIHHGRPGRGSQVFPVGESARALALAVGGE